MAEVERETAGPVEPGPRTYIKLAIDFGPLLVFFGVNALGNIFWATGAFMVAFAVALVVGFILERRLEAMPIFTGVVVFVFGGLTLYLKDETFIKLKPTILYGILSFILFGGLLAGRPLIKILFEHIVQLTEEGWHKLTLRWGVFFACLALLNEVVWRSVSTDTWVAVKVWGFVPLTIIFTIAQAPFVKRHELPGTSKG